MVSKIVKPCEYNTGSLTFMPLLGLKKKSTESTLLPYYDGARSPLIQLPPVDLDMYGISSECNFYKEDYQRMFLKLPLNQTNTDIRELTEGFLKKLNDKLRSEEFKVNVLGTKNRTINTSQLSGTSWGKMGSQTPTNTHI